MYIFVFVCWKSVAQRGWILVVYGKIPFAKRIHILCTSYLKCSLTITIAFLIPYSLTIFVDILVKIQSCFDDLTCIYNNKKK